jgi:glycosyltransferase involved in cell wall biosynthesis
MTLSDIRCCIIIPTYNNQKTLRRVIDGVLEYSKGEDIIVINDGSTDETRAILNSYEGKIRVLTNEKNSGKGYSLRKGFKEAIKPGL